MSFEILPGRVLKAARVALGLTQKKLAQELLTSQARISLVERGRISAPRLRQLMAQRLNVQPSPAPTDAVVMSRPRSVEVTGWVQSERWSSRPESGDFHDVVQLENDHVFLAGDVAGNGPAILPLASYLHGFACGYLSTGATPDPTSYALALLDECATRGIASSLCVGVLRLGQATRGHRIQVATFGYPEPLLVAGPPYRTPIPTVRELKHMRSQLNGRELLWDVSEPWRLIVASDGLLSRLGGGDEAKGRRSLLRWAQGSERDRPIASFVGNVEPMHEDESILILEEDNWDLERDINPCSTAVADLHEEIRKHLRATPVLAMRVNHVMDEALTNVFHHAQVAKATVGLRSDRDVVRLRVMDSGPGMPEHPKRRGLEAMRGHSDWLTVERAHPSGTIITVGFSRKDTADG